MSRPCFDTCSRETFARRAFCDAVEREFDRSCLCFRRRQPSPVLSGHSQQLTRARPSILLDDAQVLRTPLAAEGVRMRKRWSTVLEETARFELIA
uniref:Apple domain-containing protein n=1 Tax=Bursaphelenchus xylophilus TaxID=6326 RepID=A0A1I7RRW8_BURXY